VEKRKKTTRRKEIDSKVLKETVGRKTSSELKGHLKQCLEVSGGEHQSLQLGRGKKFKWSVVRSSSKNVAGEVVI